MNLSSRVTEGRFLWDEVLHPCVRVPTANTSLCQFLQNSLDFVHCVPQDRQAIPKLVSGWHNLRVYLQRHCEHCVYSQGKLDARYRFLRVESRNENSTIIGWIYTERAQVFLLQGLPKLFNWVSSRLVFVQIRWLIWRHGWFTRSHRWFI